MPALRSFAASALICVALPAAGEERGTETSLEMPAHRALMREVGEGAHQPAPFTTDGCSGGLSSVWRVVADRFPDFSAAHGNRPPWELCCVIHDRAYHNAGGAKAAPASAQARRMADEALQTCVQTQGADRADELAAHYDVTPATVLDAYDLIAGSMYRAVRLGGGPCSGLPWRWGYGYPNCVVTFQDF